MKDRIIVKTSDLLQALQRVSSYYLDYVQLTVLDEDQCDGDTIPAQLHIEGSVSPDFEVSIDFNEIDLFCDDN